MQGFKSFADKTVLSFEGGVTGIVGPNGSGKSNISDAIRWVMGEMSAKTLRGANMQDVIFNGTQTRKPLNFAEVSLVLDNSEGIFPIEYDEIMVTRRVFRSGETAYKINGAACRLKDIQELFMDTGLGRDGYSMIGQGNVAQILSTKSEDRRNFFEGAAGVSKYKHRKEEAERKLTAVTENLVRINDITTELESQIKPLERQSKKAREYLVLYEEYKGLDVSLILLSAKKGSTQLLELSCQKQNLENEISSVKSGADEFELKMADLYIENEKKDGEQTQTNNALLDNESSISKIENDISIATNNIENNNALKTRIDGEIASIYKKNEQLSQKIAESEQIIKQKQEENSGLVSKFAKMQEDSGAVYSELEDCMAKIDSLKSQVMEKSSAVASGKTQIEGLEKLRSTYLERKNAAEAEREARKHGCENTKKEIKENEEKLKDAEEKLSAMKTRIDVCERKLGDLNADEKELSSALAEKQLDFAQKTSKKRMLEAMENDYEGYARSVKAVLKANELKSRRIYGTLSGLISVDKEYVTAIETALGGALQNIVVESEEDAKAAITYLRNNKLGRATFLPISSVTPKRLENEAEIKSNKGVIALASELAKTDKKYSKIVDSLLARTVVTDNIDNAIALSKKYAYRFRTVTLLGDILNSGGAISGGSVNKTSGFLSRASEIKTLESEISRLSLELQKEKKELESKRTDIDNLNMQLESFQPLAREYENDILVLKNSNEHLLGTLNNEESEKGIDAELATIDAELLKSQEEIAVLIASVRTGENDILRLNEEIEKLSKEYESIQAQKEQKAQDIMDETVRMRSIEQEISAEKQNIESIKQTIAENIDEIAKKTADKAEIEKKNTELLAEIEEKREKIAETLKVSEKIKVRLSEIEQEKAVILEKLKGMQTQNKELTDRLILLQQELSRLENKEERLTMQQDGAISRLWDDYELTLETAEEVKAEIDDEKAASLRASELKSKIKSLGSINIDSIEEYKNVKERFEFLSSQKADLENAKSNLTGVIDSMQELMEEHFAKRFEEINKSFGKVFSELFGGGHGRLYLSRPEDVLESGIEIEAQLPGKSLQNINLYSGGEKSFIAIALLFAILRVKPTPFCILDEIDAALDDSNVWRFATYLKNYIDDTQFVVITHRRGTMEAANTLYGVTMQEKGVTKMLALNIDEVDENLIK
ncbi:MAG: chromosome segregation protein SMC [Firmicutes bacterium]|nr:chromosome segregation protein SMC [Bacillota bacterium]